MQLVEKLNVNFFVEKTDIDLHQTGISNYEVKVILLRKFEETNL